MSHRSRQGGTGEISNAKWTAFLSWLQPEPEDDGETYELARRRLILYFAHRHCIDPESLADRTLDVTMMKVADIPASVKPLAYLFGVAKNIYHDYLREQQKDDLRREGHSATYNHSEMIQVERRHACLEGCLGQLATEDQQLLLAYYAESKQQKIEMRKALAFEGHLSLNALRNRVFRLNQRLAPCVSDCIEKKEL